MSLRAGTLVTAMHATCLLSLAAAPHRLIHLATGVPTECLLHAGCSPCPLPWCAPCSVTSPISTSVTGSAVVSWSAASPNNAPILTYVIQYSSDADTPDIGSVTVSDGSTLTQEVPGLMVTDMYTFTVYATNAATDEGTESVASSPAVLVKPALPAVPTALVVEAASPETLSVSWSAPTGQPNNVVTHYEVQARLDVNGGQFEDITTAPVNAIITGTTVTAVGLQVHTLYVLRVRTVNQSGECQCAAAVVRAFSLPAALQRIRQRTPRVVLVPCSFRRAGVVTRAPACRATAFSARTCAPWCRHGRVTAAAMHLTFSLRAQARPDSHGK